MAHSSLLRRVFVSLLPRWVDAASHQHLDSRDSNAIVIDTLRFTTTACHALRAGANSVRVAATVEQARNLAAQVSQRPLLCGERHCNLIEGFDLGNSPSEYSSSNVQGRDLVFTTTNGTLAVEAVRQSKHILLAALVNRAAVCRTVQTDLTGDLAIVCAGTDGQVAVEDVLTAGAIVDQLLQSEDFTSGHDTATLAVLAWQAVHAEHVFHQLETRDRFHALVHALQNTLGGRNLLDAGYENDIQFAAQIDTIDATPRNVENEPSHFVLSQS